MKVEINENKSQGEVKYPCLRKSSNGNVFLCRSDGSSIVLEHDGVGGFQIGDITKLVNHKLLTPFNGSITLSND
jgi:hypothetical protein